MLYDDNISDDQFRNVMEHVLTSETALFFSISKDGTKNVARQYCYDSRLRQEYPCVEMDYYGDGDTQYYTDNNSNGDNNMPEV